MIGDGGAGGWMGVGCCGWVVGVYLIWPVMRKSLLNRLNGGGDCIAEGTSFFELGDY